jgi:hypothetical protein
LDNTERPHLIEELPTDTIPKVSWALQEDKVSQAPQEKDRASQSLQEESKASQALQKKDKVSQALQSGGAFSDQDIVL